jgi:hypothetical protein
MLTEPLVALTVAAIGIENIVGVELGQLCIVAACLPLTFWLFRRSWGLRASTALSGVLSFAGLVWFVQRALA